MSTDVWSRSSFVRWDPINHHCKTIIRWIAAKLRLLHSFLILLFQWHLATPVLDGLLEYHRLSLIKNNLSVITFNWVLLLSLYKFGHLPFGDFKIFFQLRLSLFHLFELHFMHFYHIVLSLNKLFHFLKPSVILERIQILNPIVLLIKFFIIIFQLFYSIFQTINMKFQLLLYTEMLSYFRFKLLNNFFINLGRAITQRTTVRTILLAWRKRMLWIFILAWVCLTISEVLA